MGRSRRERIKKLIAAVEEANKDPGFRKFIKEFVRYHTS